MSDWIRPTGCEGGACVEYRTVDGKVFVRNGGTENLSDDGNMLVFTVAEWDTFVAGLTAPIAAELADAHTIAQRANTRAEALAAENARMRQEVAAAKKFTLERLKAALADQFEIVDEDLEDARRQLAVANEGWAETLRQRDAAIAEAAVLRHRDRRTQAVVDAAVRWRELVGDYPNPASHSVGALMDAVDAYQERPSAALAAPQSDEQPSDVAEEATDGLEAQGGAQQDEAFCSVCDHDDHRCPGCGSSIEHGAITCDDCIETPEESAAIVDANLRAMGSAGLTVRTPRVWNAGDPEPEGVERVRGRHFLWRLTDRGWYDVNRHGEDVDGNHGVSWATWSWVLNDAPLTEVLPEPAAPTAADLQAARDQTRAAAKTMLTVTEPGIKVLVPDLSLGAALSRAGKAREVVPTFEDDGEVREAGRAGEAQEARLYSADLDPDASKNSSDVRPQDRTEGLAAAIEAGLVGWDARVQQGSLARHTGEARREVVKAVIRAASPLIERAALQAAEDALGEEVDNAIEPSDREALMHACDVVRRLRATRTETS